MKHTCHARNCRVFTERVYLMCPHHWRMVPKNLQHAVWDHFERAQLKTKLPSKEWHDAADAAIKYVYELENKKRAISPAIKGEKTMKLDLGILVGAESKQWLADLTTVVERLEAVANVATKSRKASTTDTADEDTDTEEKVIRSAKALKAKTKAEPQEEFSLDEDGNEETETEAPTIKDVIAACKANRTEAVKVLKRMKVNSVHELKPTQYTKVLAEIGA